MSSKMPLICLAPHLSPLGLQLLPQNITRFLYHGLPGSSILFVSPVLPVLASLWHGATGACFHFQLICQTGSVRVMKATLEQINQGRGVKFLPQQLCWLSGKRVLSLGMGIGCLLQCYMLRISTASIFNNTIFIKFCLRLADIAIQKRLTHYTL